MTRRILLALLLLSSLVLLHGCASEGWCTFATGVNKAGYAVSQKVLGALAGPEPDWGRVTADCLAGVDRTPTQPDDPLDSASWQPTAGICAKPYNGTDPCAACVRTWCCAETFKCLAEQSCTCHMAAPLGIDWPKESPCGDADEAFGAESACLDEHCAEECYP